MMRNGFLLLASLAFVTAAFAQEEKWDVSGDYSYLRFNPTLQGFNSRSFNGGGGSGQFNVNKWLGIKGDFQGYASTTWKVTYNGPIVTPHGTVPAGTYSTNGNMFTWMFGPVIRIPANKFTLWGETLFGGSQTNAYATLSKEFIANGADIKLIGSQHPFTMTAGGGLDLNMSKTVALRLGEFDYVLTRYTNPLTSTNNQNSFRYAAGVVFMFGGEK